MQLTGFTVGPVQLTGMGIALALDQMLLRLAVVALPQFDPSRIRCNNQSSACQVVEPLVNRKSDLLVLHHGIYVNPIELVRPDRLEPESGRMVSFSSASPIVCESASFSTDQPIGCARSTDCQTAVAFTIRFAEDLGEPLPGDLPAMTDKWMGEIKDAIKLAAEQTSADAGRFQATS